MLMVSVVTILAVGINRITVADEQCFSYEFESPFFPGISCEDIYNKNSQVRNKSGYYWITDGPSNVYCGMNYTGLSCVDIYNNNRETDNKNGYYPINNNQWTFCNMTAIAASYFTFSCAGVGGEWRKIASFNISAGDDCPNGWNRSSHNNVSFCRSHTDKKRGCFPVMFSTNHIGYQRVCGRARGYQKGSTDAFLVGGNIDLAYVDGLSITHGSPRQHIWTYAAGRAEHVGDEQKCPCTASPGLAPPSFVGSNYYCESGSENWSHHDTYYLSDPLWDGSGCSSGNNCCSNINLPWFQYQLNQTTEDDIEARICTSSLFTDEAVLIDILELYVQ